MDEYIETYLTIRGKIEDKVVDGTRETFTFYDYIDSPLYEFYNDFVKFAKSVNSRLIEEHILIDNVNFYFFDKKLNDAYFSSQINGLKLIGVSNMILENLVARSKDLYSRLNRIAISMNLKTKGVFNKSLNEFVFEIARNFLLFHELGHAVQSNLNEHQNLTSENLVLQEADDFEIIKHINELDADNFATLQIIRFIVNKFNNNLPQYRSTESLELLIAFSLIGIYLLFDLLSDELQRPIFFKQGTHPHPCIRIRYAIETYEESVNSDPDLPDFDHDRMLAIFSKVLINAKLDSGKNFLKIMGENQALINAYLHDMGNEMSDKAKYGYLFIYME